MTRRFGALLILVACALDATTSTAALSNPTAEAAIRDGKNSYNSGNYEAAIQSFKRAYTLQPDSEILYQLGKAYAMADWPVEAVDAFERYLDAAGTGLSTKRRLELVEAIEGQKRRIGTLILQVTPSDSRVTLDEAALDRAAQAKPMQVRQGSHVVAASFDGYAPQVQSVQVRGKQTEFVKLVLVPVRPQIGNGLLEIRCPLPGVAILVDNRQVGTTPATDPILLAEGSHELRLERIGYRSQTTTVQLTSARTTPVVCDLPLVQPLPASGQLELELPEAGAEILVDGMHATQSNLLPPGLHSVEIRHYGYEPWMRDLRVDVGRANRVSVALVPTPAYVHDLEQRAQQRRTWSYVLGATGLAVAGTALGIGLWNHGRYSDWERKRNELESAYKTTSSGTPAAAELESKRHEVNRQLNSIHAVDIATAMLGVAGGMLLGSGAFVFFMTEVPQSQHREPAARLRIPQGVGINVAW